MHLKLLILKINLHMQDYLMQELNGLNICELNIYQHLLFMNKIKNDILYQKSIKICFSESKNKYNTKITFTQPFCR